MNHAPLREALYLVKNGVPFDVAFSMRRTERHAWSIVMGELEGGQFNWASFSFEDPKGK